MKEMELIDAVELRRKAETCIETTDAFIELIDSARVYIWCGGVEENGITTPVMDLRPRTCEEWIPISSKLPSHQETILFCDIDGDVYSGERYGYKTWWDYRTENIIKNVVAWMPLPKPYKGE